MKIINFSNLVPELRIGLERFVAGAFIMLLFWIAAKIAEWLVSRLRKRMPHNAGLLLLLARTTKIGVLTFGAATALGTMGVNVSALVAGLGLTGFALGFAFRDVLSNLLAGILLLLFRPFGIDDQISVTGLDGRVINIDLRHTILKQADKTVLIPNSNLFTNPILVFGETQQASSIKSAGWWSARDFAAGASEDNCWPTPSGGSLREESQKPWCGPGCRANAPTDSTFAKAIAGRKHRRCLRKN